MVLKFPFRIEINSTAERGKHVALGGWLFTYTPYKSTVVRLHLSKQVAKHLNQSKQVFFRPRGLGATSFTQAQIQKVTSNEFMQRVRVDIELPSFAKLDEGQEIEVRFDAPKLTNDIEEDARFWFEPGPPDANAVADATPLALPPRGVAGGYLPLAAAHKAALDGASAPKKGVRFGLALADRNHQSWTSQSLKRPRTPIILSEDRWVSTHISTAVVDQITVSTIVTATAQLETRQGGPNPIAIKAPAAGRYLPVRQALYSLLRPNEVIGTIELAESTIDLQRSYLNANPDGADRKVAVNELRSLGFTGTDLHQLRVEGVPLPKIPVISRRGGLIASLPVETGQIVGIGSPVAMVVPATQHLLSCWVDREAFERLPRSVRLEVAADRNPFAGGVDQWERIEAAVFGEALEDISNKDRIKVDFWLGLRKIIAVSGKEIELGKPVRIRLVAASADRQVLCVPADCVTTVGKSTEVLVHTGGGVLTPAPVLVGGQFEDKIEIVSGLKAGERVARTLSSLRDEDVAIGATMLGFWASAENSV